MPAVGFELVVILLLILANGLFAMAEMALVSARKARLLEWAEAGNTRARAALELAQNPGEFLSTVQIGITLVGILAGAFGGARLAAPLADVRSRTTCSSRAAPCRASAPIARRSASASWWGGSLTCRSSSGSWCRSSSP